jgi:N-acetylmuramoyl-L-alanine amidase
MHKYPDIDALLKTAWDYNRRWIIACVIMGLLCAAVIPYTVWAVWNEHNRTEEVYIAEPLAAFTNSDDAETFIDTSIVSSAEANDEVRYGLDAAEVNAYTEIPVVDDTTEPDEPLIEAALSAYYNESPLVPLHWTTGLYYDPSNTRIYLPDDTEISEITSDYINRIHTVTISDTLPGVYSVYIGDRLINNVLISGNYIFIRTQRGAFIGYDANAGTPYIELSDPHDKYKSVIVLDPGHGGYDPGALGENGLLEKDINLNIMFYLMDILNRDDILLLPTRTTDEFISKDYRARFGNSIGDYFISIHNNADETSSKPSGTVTYYTPNNTGGLISGKEMGMIFQEEMVEALGSRDRGALGGGDFVVLNQAAIPAVIVESLFMTNESDLAQLSQPETQMKIAEALRDAIYRLP